MSQSFKNVLVIDDEEEIAGAAKRMLEKSGYSVDTASNGKQGMDIISENQPDVIITDIIMPIMDGYEFYKQLKKKNLTSDIPVIILTARPNMEDSFKALGVEGFVTKPFTGESLINKIEQLGKTDEFLGARGAMLVAGSDEYATSHIVTLLNDDGYAARGAAGGADLIAKALAKVPNFIFLDLFMKDVPCREVVKALRCFRKLDDTQLILYVNFKPDDRGTMNHLDYIQTAKQACMDAGANHYIGRFSTVNFIQSVNTIKNSL